MEGHQVDQRLRQRPESLHRHGYSWYDPDVNAYGSDVTRQGVDLYSYPSSRVYSFGLKLTF